MCKLINIYIQQDANLIILSKDTSFQDTYKTWRISEGTRIWSHKSKTAIYSYALWQERKLDNLIPCMCILKLVIEVQTDLNQFKLAHHYRVVETGK